MINDPRKNKDTPWYKTRKLAVPIALFVVLAISAFILWPHGTAPTEQANNLPANITGQEYFGGVLVPSSADAFYVNGRWIAKKPSGTDTTNANYGTVIKSYPSFEGSGKLYRDAFNKEVAALPSFTLKLDNNDYGRIPTQSWLQAVFDTAKNNNFDVGGDYNLRVNQDADSVIDNAGVAYPRMRVNGNEWDRVFKFTDSDGIEKYKSVSHNAANVNFDDNTVEIDKLATLDPSYNAPATDVIAAPQVTTQTVTKTSETTTATTPPATNTATEDSSWNQLKT